MSPLRIAIAALATWRLTHLLHTEDGPFAIFNTGRRWLRRASLSGLVDCFLCLSVWVAAPFAFALAETFADALMLTFALSGAAILIHRSAAKAEPIPAAFFEEPYREEKQPWPAAAEYPELSQPLNPRSTLGRSA